MMLSIIQKINEFNEFLFAPIDNILTKLPFDEWVVDAIVDSIHLLPFLFFIFIVIEILEFYFFDRINSGIKYGKKRSVLIGALASIFPQCGFSVMASSLYSKKIITRGCIIAVYLGTSDECLPILLAHPEKFYFILPVIGVKFITAISAGYFIDLIWNKYVNKQTELPNEQNNHEEHEHEHEHDECELEEIGCCNHSPETHNRREILIHPILHTANIFTFILIITLILNYTFEHLSITNILINNGHPYITCIISGIIGLIPNCAVSVAVTMMLIKGSISFGAAMSALLANGGLGLLVLIKNNDFKDTIRFISQLLLISIITGCIIDWIYYSFIHTVNITAN